MVRAKVVYTKRDNGLRRLWYGTTYCNPPWSFPLVWVKRCAEHDDGVVLCKRLDPSTAWYREAWEMADVVIQLAERTRYWEPKRRRGRIEVVRCGTPEFGSVLFYRGPDPVRAAALAEMLGHYVVKLRVQSTVGIMAAMSEPEESGLELLVQVAEQQARKTVLLEWLSAADGDEPIGSLHLPPPFVLHDVCQLSVAEIGAIGRAKNVVTIRRKNGVAKAAKAPPRLPKTPPNGAGRQLAPTVLVRVDQARAAIEKLGLTVGDTVATQKLTEAMGCSRQTTLRTLVHVPELVKEGKGKQSLLRVVEVYS